MAQGRAPLLLALLVGATLAACGSGPSAAPTSSVASSHAVSAAPAATPTRAPSPEPSRAPTPAPTEPYALGSSAMAPGEYATSLFEPRLTFTVGEGWSSLFPDDPDEIALDRDQGTTGLGITRATKVVYPATGQAVAVPDDLIGWLSEHPALEAEAPGKTKIAGIEARYVDTVATATRETFAYDTGNMRVIDGDHTRFYVVPLDGPDLTIILVSSAERFDEALPLVAAIVAFMAITPGLRWGSLPTRDARGP